MVSLERFRYETAMRELHGLTPPFDEELCFPSTSAPPPVPFPPFPSLHLRSISCPLSSPPLHLRSALHAARVLVTAVCIARAMGG